MRLRRGPESASALAFAGADRPGDGIAWRDAGWCAVDLEMTGLNPRTDEIIAIGAVPIDGGRVVLGGGMYTLVRASKRSQVGAVLVHKLRLADVQDAPSLDEAIDLLLTALAGRVPVFHTGAIESAFLRPQFARRHVGFPAAADTEVLGRTWLRHRDGVEPAQGQSPARAISLGGLAAQLGQPAEAPHHALGDALTTAQVFIALASLLDTVAPQTVGSLVGAGAHERRFGARRFGPG
jgi:DNA polymerase-3 subunit epsilon